MYGARPETDKMARMGFFNAAKTHQFSERIRDRFHAVGYTASFEKHAKSVQPVVAEGIENSNPSKVQATKKKSSGGGLSERQLNEMRADEARLRAIEEQLETIRERKRLKEQRERLRAEKKLLHVSSVIIQTAAKRFMNDKKDCAADALVNFLRCLSLLHLLVIIRFNDLSSVCCFSCQHVCPQAGHHGDRLGYLNLTPVRLFLGCEMA